MVFQHWTGVWLSLHFYISPARTLIIVKKKNNNNNFPLTDYIFTCAFGALNKLKFNVKICSELLSLKELFYFGVHDNKAQILCEWPLPSCIQEEFL